jgi:hypothetical protein
MATNTNGKQNTAIPAHSMASAISYDIGGETEGGNPFDFNSSFADAVGACATAVVAAGDMFMLTTDKGHYAVHIVVRSNRGGHDKWYTDTEKAVKALDKLYDIAVAKRNAQNPPRLQGT